LSGGGAVVAPAGAFVAAFVAAEEPPAPKQPAKSDTSNSNAIRSGKNFVILMREFLSFSINFVGDASSTRPVFESLIGLGNKKTRRRHQASPRPIPREANQNLYA